VFTKKDFAEYLISKHAEKEGVSVEEVKQNPSSHALKSTSCGIALEYLGMLEDDPDVKKYLSSRSGIFLNYESINEEGKFEVKSLSVKELFDLLFDEIKEKE
jgi:hypothetical protein